MIDIVKLMSEYQAQSSFELLGLLHARIGPHTCTVMEARTIIVLAKNGHKVEGENAVQAYAQACRYLEGVVEHLYGEDEFEVAEFEFIAG